MRLKHFWLPILVLLTVIATSSAAQSRIQAPRTEPRESSATESSANLWVDGDGGSCSRSATPVAYRDRAACGSIDTAWDACRSGDTITIKAGSYGPQAITGDKAEPGCTVSGENGTTIGDLGTGGAFFTLRNVTIDVGNAKRAGWEGRASNVTLSNVRLHGPFVSVDIFGVSNVSWIGGELGTAGQAGGPRVCGEDAEPLQIGEADHVTIDAIRFHPQSADPTPNSCSANGFHLEMIRLDGGTTFFTLRNSTFDNGDHSGTASIFITQPGDSTGTPHDLTFENNFFGTNESVGAFDVHSNVAVCRAFTLAYNTFLQSPGVFQCGSAVNTRWIGNLGAFVAQRTCLGTFTNNVWQDSSRDACGTDKWVLGTRGQTDKLGLGGPDGFHLQPGSPATNAGEAAGYCTSTLRSKDHDGRPRQIGTRCDAGADEDEAGPAVVASLAGPRWRRTHSGGRILWLTLRNGETVDADVHLLHGSGTMAAVTYEALKPGTRRLILTLGENVVAGAASVRVALKDAAGNKLVIERAVKVPR